MFNRGFAFPVFPLPAISAVPQMPMPPLPSNFTSPKFMHPPTFTVPPSVTPDEPSRSSSQNNQGKEQQETGSVRRLSESRENRSRGGERLASRGSDLGSRPFSREVDSAAGSLSLFSLALSLSTHSLLVRRAAEGCIHHNYFREAWRSSCIHNYYFRRKSGSESGSESGQSEGMCVCVFVWC